MSLAPQELENTASKYAAEAIRLDSQGSMGMAVQSYQYAIEALVKLIQIYPDYKLNKIYMERARTYQNRIKALQMTDGTIESKSEKSDLTMGKLKTILQRTQGLNRTNTARAGNDSASPGS